MVTPYYLRDFLSKLHSLSSHDICITFHQNFINIKVKHRVKINHNRDYKI